MFAASLTATNIGLLIEHIDLYVKAIPLSGFGNPERSGGAASASANDGYTGLRRFGGGYNNLLRGNGVEEGDLEGQLIC